MKALEEKGQRRGGTFFKDLARGESETSLLSFLTYLKTFHEITKITKIFRIYDSSFKCFGNSILETAESIPNHG